MEWHRVKNIVIVILLLINGFLLVLVGTRKSEALRYEQSALEGAILVLQDNGISLTEDVIADRTGRDPGTVERSLALEGQLASALLGESVEGVNRGGGLYIYTAQGGQISFRSGGELSSVLEDHPRWHADDPEAHAAGLAGALGLELRLEDSEISMGSGAVEYRQLMDGAPLFSCGITFAYEDSRLVKVSGTLLPAEEAGLESGQLLSLPTVLMNLLDEVLSSGSVSSAILAVEPGWLPKQSFNDAVELEPVWHITTNTTDYYVDGLTGEVDPAAGN